ncbi:RDD family protein [Acetobacteraceae bacterium ESL0709]|nr:RDD family protein [Acetobacteraceae bacterium ESL0697]MDF7678538.1 RDD family protein [Acetobacteraceae bacterium ESL0709]
MAHHITHSNQTQHDSDFIQACYAGLWTRFWARMTDFAVFSAVLLSLFVVVFSRPDTVLQRLSTLTLLQSALVDLESFIFLYALYSASDSIICRVFGRNLGHKIYGIRPVSISPEPVAYSVWFRRAFLLNIINIPYIWTLIYVVLYLRYRKTNVTYWDRLTRTRVIAETASLGRTIFCVAIPSLCLASFIGLVVYAGYTGRYAPDQPEPVSRAESDILRADLNAKLPARLNDLTILQNVTGSGQELVFNYLISKEGDKHFILTGFGPILKYRTAMFYPTRENYCTGKGGPLREKNYTITQVFWQQGTVLMQTHITPQSCQRQGYGP